MPPRWFVVFFWHAHRLLLRLTRGRLGLWRPKQGGWGALRLTTTGRRTGQPRQVVVGYFEDGDFVFAGKVGTGFDTKLLRELRARFDRIEVAQPPFTRAAGLPRLRAHWVRPEVVVQVAFTEWTVHGKLRHPRLLGLRPDKLAREVVRET